MAWIASIRRIAFLFLAGSGMAFAQSTLPPTSATAQPAAAPIVAAPATLTVATRPGRPATVFYIQGQLQIAANNSSLNQILREISRLTGMTITGGVTDQRVFGNYGPAPPTDILADLLAGTGSNMLLLNNSSNAPAELILTPQQGGPTPPNPGASASDDDASSDNPLKPLQPNQPPAGGPNDPSTEATRRSRFVAMPAQSSSTGSPAAGTDSGTNPPPVGTGNPPSPNGVRTPQQIYQQLQQLQRAQQPQQ